MGEPLAKVVLTASSYGAWKMTKYGYTSLLDKNLRFRPAVFQSENHSTVKQYCCAGDDHAGIGSTVDLQKIPKFMETMGFEISWDKYRISRVIISYCQEFGLHPRFNIIKEGHYGKSNCGSIHVDTPKHRLLSQAQKMGGKENFDTPDPLVGKAKALGRSWAMMAERKERIVNIQMPHMCEPDKTVSQRYVDRMEFYGRMIPIALRLLMPSWFEMNIVNDEFAFLPTQFGGLGIPNLYVGDWKPGIYNMMRVIEYQSLVGLKLDRKTKTLIKWERGLEFQCPTIDHLLTLGKPLAELILTAPEAFDKTKEKILSNSDAESVGNWRVTKQLYRDYVDITKNVTLVGDKESAYTAYMLRGTVDQVIPKKKRARQVLSEVRKNAMILIDEGLVPFEFESRFTMRLGVPQWTAPNGWVSEIMPRYAEFISRKVLDENFHTGLIKPSLSIPSSYFSLRGARHAYMPVQIPIWEHISNITSLSAETVTWDTTQGSPDDLGEELESTLSTDASMS